MKVAATSPSPLHETGRCFSRVSLYGQTKVALDSMREAFLLRTTRTDRWMDWPTGTRRCFEWQVYKTTAVWCRTLSFVIGYRTVIAYRKLPAIESEIRCNSWGTEWKKGEGGWVREGVVRSGRMWHWMVSRRNVWLWDNGCCGGEGQCTIRNIS